MTWQIDRGHRYQKERFDAPKTLLSRKYRILITFSFFVNVTWADCMKAPLSHEASRPEASTECHAHTDAAKLLLCRRRLHNRLYKFKQNTRIHGCTVLRRLFMALCLTKNNRSDVCLQMTSQQYQSHV